MRKLCSETLCEEPTKCRVSDKSMIGGDGVSAIDLVGACKRLYTESMAYTATGRKLSQREFQVSQT